MSKFKEMAFRDIGNVFMNPKEFGEMHTVDGKQMIVSIDGMEVVERAKKQSEHGREHGRIDGVFKQQIILYVARNEFGDLPAMGRVLKLDNSNYRVMDAIDEAGIFSITLEAIRS